MSPQATRTGGNNPAAPRIFPPVGGIRFVMAKFAMVAPEATPEMPMEDGDEPGMHRTDTTDFGVLLSGNVVLELDDGAEVLLSPGDVVVQRELATVGAWLGTCQPPWLLSSSEPTAFRIQPGREVAIAMTRQDRCGYRHPAEAPGRRGTSGTMIQAGTSRQPAGREREPRK